MALVTRTCRIVYAAFVASTLTRCTPDAPQVLSAAERTVVDAWLFCIECDGAQLDSVLALANRKPTATIDTLAADLLSGLVNARRDSVRAKFAASHATLGAQALEDGTSPPMAEPDYVDYALRNASSLTRTRAALALATIGGARAREALEGAADSASGGSASFAGSVARAVLYARDSLWHP